jgi:hypothetical protein
MSMKYFILSCIVLLMISGCGGVAVQTETANDANFAGFSSYEWLDVASVDAGGVRANSPEVAAWVKASVDRQLLNKGYVKSTNGQPDFLLSWLGGVEKKVKVESIDHLYSSYGYGPVAASMPLENMKGGMEREYKEGTILLDVLDPKTHKMLWRGSGTAKLLQGMKKEDAALYVDRLVKNICKAIPEAKAL